MTSDEPIDKPAKVMVEDSAKAKAEEDMTQTISIEPATENAHRYRHLRRLLDLYRLCEDVEEFVKQLKRLGRNKPFDVMVAPEKRTEEIMPTVSPDVIVEAYVESITDDVFEEMIRNVHWGKNYTLSMEDWTYQPAEPQHRRSSRLRRDD